MAAHGARRGENGRPCEPGSGCIRQVRGTIVRSRRPSGRRTTGGLKPAGYGRRRPGRETINPNLKLAVKRRKTPLAALHGAVARFREGKMIIVVDDENRENEGD